MDIRDFQVGDRIMRISNNNRSFKIGDIAIITRINDEFVYITDNEGQELGNIPSKIAKVNENDKKILNYETIDFLDMFNDLDNLLLLHLGNYQSYNITKKTDINFIYQMDYKTNYNTFNTINDFLTLLHTYNYKNYFYKGKNFLYLRGNVLIMKKSDLTLTLKTEKEKKIFLQYNGNFSMHFKDNYINYKVGQGDIKLLYKCKNCKTIFKPIMINETFNIMCNDCLNEKYEICNKCNNYHLKSEFVDNDLGHYCSNCIAFNTFECSICNKLHWTTEKCYIKSYICICKECANLKYNQCSICGKWTLKTDTENYCLNCHACSRCCRCDFKGINGYSFKPSPIFFGTDKDDLFFGSELEVDYKGSRYSSDIEQFSINLHNKFNQDKFFYNKSDGSLNNGLEIVSHPFSINYMLEKKEHFAKMFEYILDNDYDSDNTSTCGLHFHLSKKAFTCEQTEDFMFLIEKYKKEIDTFSRRHGDLHWCQFRTNNYIAVDKKSIVDTIKNTDDGSRYRAVNLNNDNTIEVRIFKGTLNIDTYLASLELCYNLYCITKDNQDIEKISFNDIININDYKEIKDYWQKIKIESER